MHVARPKPRPSSHFSDDTTHSTNLGQVRPREDAEGEGEAPGADAQVLQGRVLLPHFLRGGGLFNSDSTGRLVG